MIRLALLCSAALAGTAAAQTRPNVTPTRDVDVTYQTKQGSQVLEQRMRWAVAEQLLRVDPPTAGFHVVMDYRAHRMQMVRDADRKVLDMDAGSAPLPGQPGASAAAFTRRGTDQVAGLPCTEWETTDAAGAATLTCFTDDGVMLRARQGAQVLAEAARVVYGPQDPASLRPPAGYEHGTPPAIPPAGAMEAPSPRP